jgi:hypothetical protein
MVLANRLQHKNLLSIKCTFIAGSDLWVLQDCMNCGSLETILRTNYPNGIKDQILIATILKETL